MSLDTDGDCLAALAGVSKWFGGTVALDGVDLRVRPGELLAVLGPNGAGKTTAISLLLGLEQADHGSVRLLGQSPLSLEARRHVGVMMQEVHLAPELRVREQIDLVASYYAAPLCPEAAMEMTHTTSLGNRHYGTLSGGQKRQAQFAMAVCGRPRLLFLDEPTVGLDVQARALMWTTLRQLVSSGSSIILTTHYLEEAEVLADRVTVLAKGRIIAAGTVDEVRGLVTRKQVICSTTVGVEDVLTWPGVASAIRDRQRLNVTTGDAEVLVRRLLAADGGLHDLEVRRAGLAEAFAELTEEAAP
jgi:ABC-type multidrug transport system ATPase subunit